MHTFPIHPGCRLGRYTYFSLMSIIKIYIGYMLFIYIYKVLDI